MKRNAPAPADYTLGGWNKYKNGEQIENEPT